MNKANLLGLALTLSLSLCGLGACTGKVDVNNPVFSGGTISSPSSAVPASALGASGSKMKITDVNQADGSFKLKGADGSVGQQVIKPEDAATVAAIKSGEIKEGADLFIENSENLKIVSNGKIFNFRSVTIKNCSDCSIS